MSTTVWKFPLKVTDVQEIEIPLGSRVLCVQTQHGVPVLYAHVLPGSGAKRLHVFTHGTGHPVHELATAYVGTYQLNGGHLVFHVFTDEPGVPS